MRFCPGSLRFWLSTREESARRFGVRAGDCCEIVIAVAAQVKFFGNLPNNDMSCQMPLAAKYRPPTE
jgi:hypothetical protein